MNTVATWLDIIVHTVSARYGMIATGENKPGAIRHPLSGVSEIHAENIVIRVWSSHDPQGGER